MKLRPKISKCGAITASVTLVMTVLIDLITKLAVMKNMEIGQSIPLIKGVLHLTYITNDGAAFGKMDDARWLFMSVSVLLIVFLGVLLLYWDEANPLFYLSASMVMGGGIGNMIDRIAYGEVVDFIDFCAFPSLWKWIFNGADSFVCVGAGLLVLWYILSEVQNYKKEKARKEAEKGSEKQDEN